MFKKTSMVLSFILCVLSCLAGVGSAQENPCSRPKVAVKAQFPYDKELMEYLAEKYPAQPRESWPGRIRESVLAELRMNSPDILFVPVDQQGGADCDYEIRYGVAPYGDGLLMDSNLVQKNACGFLGNILNTWNTRDPDLFRMIERNVDAHGSISQRIQEYESSHRVPPRGPEMEVSLMEEYVSPIKEERELEIKIGVRNCEGEPVYDPNHGQQVILPRHTKRGELICTKGFPQNCRSFDGSLLLEITGPQGASATFRLRKGMEASEEPLKVMTCGVDRKAVEEVSVPVQGMQMEAKAQDQVISPGEHTLIEVFLYKIAVRGQRVPAANQVIEITVKGLIDGSLSPRGKVATNEGGKVILEYRAGEKDKGIDIGARYQPEGYPDFVDAQVRVEVEPQKCWEGTVQMIVKAEAEAEKEETSRYGDGAIAKIIGEQLRAWTNYHVTVQFYFDRERGAILMGKDVDGSFHRRRHLKQETFGRCRKGEEWKIVDRIINESSEETFLTDNIQKIEVWLESLSGHSFFTLVLDPQSLLVHGTSTSYNNWKERQWICKGRTERNSPQEIEIKVPLAIPFVFSEQKNHETNVFGGEKTLKQEGSFSGVILKNVPEEAEVKYIWSVWRARCRK